jgi:hypothetical protein
MLLFRGEEHIERWREQWNQPRGATLAVDQARKLGEVWYGKKMEPDWQRFTIDEAEAALASLGLNGEFWSLR